MSMLIGYHFTELEFVRQIFGQTSSPRHWVCHFGVLPLCGRNFPVQTAGFLSAELMGRRDCTQTRDGCFRLQSLLMPVFYPLGLSPSSFAAVVDSFCTHWPFSAVALCRRTGAAHSSCKQWHWWGCISVFLSERILPCEMRGTSVGPRALSLKFLQLQPTH